MGSADFSIAVAAEIVGAPGVHADVNDVQGASGLLRGQGSSGRRCQRAGEQMSPSDFKGLHIRYGSVLAEA